MSRIRPGTLTVGIVAVLCSLVAAYTARHYLEREPEEEAALPPAAIRVPIASTDLAAGKTLQRGDIAIVSRTSAEDLPPTVMMNPADIVDRILREPVKAGDPFLVTQLYPAGMGPDLAEKLEPGFRAVTIPVSNSEALPRYLRPGSLVDVVFRTSAQRASRSRGIPETTFTLLEAMEILAIDGGSTLRAGSAAEAITLKVPAEQANILKVVEGRGELSLVLRSPKETTLASTPSNQMTLEDLLDIEPESVFQAEIYRGTSRQSLSFREEQVVQETFGGLAQFIAPVTPPVPANAQEKTSEN